MFMCFSCPDLGRETIGKISESSEILKSPKKDKSGPMMCPNRECPPTTCLPSCKITDCNCKLQRLERRVCSQPAGNHFPLNSARLSAPDPKTRPSHLRTTSETIAELKGKMVSSITAKKLSHSDLCHDLIRNSNSKSQAIPPGADHITPYVLSLLFGKDHGETQ